MKLHFAVLMIVVSGSQAWTTTTTAILPLYLVASGPSCTLPNTACRTARYFQAFRHLYSSRNNNDPNEEEWSDFEDLGFTGTSSSSSDSSISSSSSSNLIDNEDTVEDAMPQPNFAKMLHERTGAVDWTAIQTRQFSLGQDLILSNYVGNMGFDEVTDWEYYYPSEDDDERKVVQPNPFDSSK